MEKPLGKNWLYKCFVNLVNVTEGAGIESDDLLDTSPDASHYSITIMN